MVCLYLLLKLLGASVLYILTKYLQLLITLDNLILKLTNLLLQRHHKECLLLILLGRLRQRHQTLI